MCRGPSSPSADMGFALQVVSQLPHLQRLKPSCVCLPPTPAPGRSRVFIPKVGTWGHSVSKKLHASAVVLSKQRGGRRISQLPGEKGRFDLGAWGERRCPREERFGCHPPSPSSKLLLGPESHGDTAQRTNTDTGNRGHGRLSEPRRPPPPAGRRPHPRPRTVHEAQAGSQAFWGHCLFP